MPNIDELQSGDEPEDLEALEAAMTEVRDALDKRIEEIRAEKFKMPSPVDRVIDQARTTRRLRLEVTRILTEKRFGEEA